MPLTAPQFQSYGNMVAHSCLLEDRSREISLSLSGLPRFLPYDISQQIIVSDESECLS